MKMSLLGKKPAQPNQSIIDGLMILQAVAASPEPVGCTELARRFDLDVTRVNRILGTLAFTGMASRTPSRKYTAGPGIHAMAAMSLKGSKLLGVALPYLQQLGEDTGMIVSMGVLWRTEVAPLYYCKPGDELASALGQRDLYPAHSAGTGRILLAQYSWTDVKEYYTRYRPSERVNMTELQAALTQARTDGYALGSPAESVAVPIGENAVAGLAVAQTPKPIAARRVPGLVRKLRKAAEQIAAKL